MRFMPRAKPAPVVKGSQVDVSWSDVAGLDVDPDTVASDVADLWLARAGATTAVHHGSSIFTVGFTT